MTDLGAIGSYTFCGAVSGIAYVLGELPLKRIVSRVNKVPSSREFSYYAFVRTLSVTRHIIWKLGVRGLYKGVGTDLMIQVPKYSAYFSGYGIGLKIFGSQDPKVKSTPAQIYYAGCFAPLISTILSTPSDRISDIIDSHREEAKRIYTGSCECTMSLLKDLGFRGLFRGFFRTLIRDVPSTGAFFLVYEWFSDYYNLKKGHQPTGLESLFAGCVAGGVYWIIAMPFEIAKTEFQETPKCKRSRRTTKILIELYREDGFAGLFKGLTPKLIVGIPANGFCCLGFNMSSRFLDYMKSKKK